MAVTNDQDNESRKGGLNHGAVLLLHSRTEIKCTALLQKTIKKPLDPVGRKKRGHRPRVPLFQSPKSAPASRSTARRDARSARREAPPPGYRWLAGISRAAIDSGSFLKATGANQSNVFRR